MIVALFIGALLTAGCAGGDEGSQLEFQATLSGRSVADGTALNPIQLHHEEITELELDVVNISNQPVVIAHVRLEGQMLGFIFLSYDTGINETLQPGERRRIAFALDFFDLEGQAHGLLQSNLRLFGPDREPLAQTPFVVDGRGSPLATMATFNLVLAMLAVTSLSWNLVRLAQRRLPLHRFARGLRFVHTGLAFGLAASAAFSTLRIWPLSSVMWVLITTAVTGVAFLAGYTSPAGETDPLVIDLNRTMIAGTDAFRVTSQLPEIRLDRGSGPTKLPFGDDVDPAIGHLGIGPIGPIEPVEQGPAPEHRIGSNGRRILTD